MALPQHRSTAEMIPTATLGSSRSHTRPTAKAHSPGRTSSRETNCGSVSDSVGSHFRSTRPRLRSRPVTLPTSRFGDDARLSGVFFFGGSVMTTSSISDGTANSVVRIQPSAPTTSPVDGPAGCTVERVPWRVATDNPLGSIRTTESEIPLRAFWKAACSASARSGVFCGEL